MIAIEINLSSDDLKECLKWYGLAHKDKEPTQNAKRVLRKIIVIAESLAEDEELERLQDSDDD